MKLEFLGTRGEIEIRTQPHNMHSSLLLSYKGARVMIDCGSDWLGKLDGREFPRPGRILITHAHPDHAWGLKEGAPCPVYASADTWEKIGSFPISDKRVARPRRPVTYRDITLESFPVEHSIRAPANGYRISAGRHAIFYVPDVVYIPERGEAFKGIDIYVGDGATMVRSMVRKREEKLFGHTPVRTQLTWCMKEGVPRAIFTHCGSEIVRGDPQKTESRLQEMAGERGVCAEIAYDGREIVLR